jgi:hypothetical protein
MQLETGSSSPWMERYALAVKTRLMAVLAILDNGSVGYVSIEIVIVFEAFCSLFIYSRGKDDDSHAEVGSKRHVTHDGRWLIPPFTGDSVNLPTLRLPVEKSRRANLAGCDICPDAIRLESCQSCGEIANHDHHRYALGTFCNDRGIESDSDAHTRGTGLIWRSVNAFPPRTETGSYRGPVWKLSSSLQEVMLLSELA